MNFYFWLVEFDDEDEEIDDDGKEVEDEDMNLFCFRHFFSSFDFNM